MSRLRDLIPTIASGFAAVFGPLAANATPEKVLSVSQWAGEYRFVGADSQSKDVGKWSNARTPQLMEPMDACQVSNGVRTVVLTGGAQFGKSEIALNALAWAIDYEPRGILVLLPSGGEVSAWSRLKWEPTVEASPRLRSKVFVRKSRSNEGSTTAVKRFRGGAVELVTAGASKGLQMRTAGLVLAEECAQYETEVGIGGDPITAAEKRMITYGPDAKTIIASTPGFRGGDHRCRVSDEYDLSDQRRWFAPCPHCGDAQVLDFKTLDEFEGRPVFSCISCGGVIEEAHKRSMNAAGFWLPTFEHPEPDAETLAGDPDGSARMLALREANPEPPNFIRAVEIDAYAPFDAVRGYRFSRRDCEGRARGYHLWQAQSNLSAWSEILADWRKVQKGTGDEKEFAQKVLGIPYEQKVERPDHDRLYDARGAFYPTENVVPEWASMVTGAIDVQTNRLEWAVYAWGPGGVGARIATGIIAKNPLNWATWSEDAYALVNTTFKGPRYKARLADYWVVDSGGNATNEVYNFIRPLQHRDQPVLAIKGASHDKGDAPAFSKGSKITVRWQGAPVGTIRLWIIGTHQLKSRVYQGLAAGVTAAESKKLEPRALLYPRQATREQFKQLTAEHISKPDPRKKGFWVCPQGVANEQLDLAVYALAAAMNEGLDRLDDAQWQQRAAARAPDLVEQELTPLEKLARADDDGEGEEAAGPTKLVLDLTPLAAEGRKNSLSEDDLEAIREMARGAKGDD